MLNQCRGTLASFKVFKEEGIKIPDVVLEKLAQDEMGLLNEADVLDVDDLLARILYATTPPHNARDRDVSAEFPAVVD